MKNYKASKGKKVDFDINILNEPPAHYAGSAINFQNFIANPFLVNIAIEKGISYSIFEDIQKLIDLSEQKLADILSLSTKSLQRYKKDKDFRFKPIHSEKLIELAEVANFGLSVFDSKEQFNLWLDTPSFVLGNKKPSDLLTNSYGIKLVMQELNNIEHGIFV